MSAQRSGGSLRTRQERWRAMSLLVARLARPRWSRKRPARSSLTTHPVPSLAPAWEARRQGVTSSRLSRADSTGRDTGKESCSAPLEAAWCQRQDAIGNKEVRMEDQGRRNCDERDQLREEMRESTTTLLAQELMVMAVRDRGRFR